jgi:hypothetical protein
MHVQKVPCPKCYAPTERLRGAMGMQDRRCSVCKYEGRGRWQFVWDNHEAPMNRKELDRLNEKPKSMDQRYDEYIERNSPLLELKKNKNMYLLSRESWKEWIAKQQQAKQVQQQEEEKELNNPDLIPEE